MAADPNKKKSPVENCDYLDTDFCSAKAAQAVGFLLWLVRKPMRVTELAELVGEADAIALARLQQSITGDRPVRNAAGFHESSNLDALMRFNAIDQCPEWHRLLQPVWTKDDQWPSSIRLRIEEMPVRDLLSDDEAAILFEAAREMALARFGVMRGSRWGIGVPEALADG
jgi:hypothetical protein